MTANAVIDGSFADLKLIKTRSVCQLVIEIPIERAEEAVQKFGIPLPGQEIAVAIARIATPPAEPKQPDPSRSDRARAQYRALPADKRMACDAARLCADARFQQFARDRKGLKLSSDLDERTRGNLTAHWMRDYLGVLSRKDVAIDPEARRKYEALELEYKAWAGLMPEMRG